MLASGASARNRRNGSWAAPQRSWPRRRLSPAFSATCLAPWARRRSKRKPHVNKQHW